MSPVVRDNTPRAPQVVFDLGVPVLGTCYGQQTMCEQLGGTVEPGTNGEFGRAMLEITAQSMLFDGFWQVGGQHPVWMSHGDHVARLPEGFSVFATSSGAPFAVVADESRHYYGVQFHPESIATAYGHKLLSNFLQNAGMNVAEDIAQQHLSLEV